MIDIATVKDWLPLLQLAGTAAVFVVALWLRSKFVPREEFAAATKKFEEATSEIRHQIAEKHTRLERGEARFDRIDHALAQLPTQVHLHAFAIEIARLSGSIDTLGARLEGHEKLTGRLESAVDRHESIFAEGKR